MPREVVPAYFKWRILDNNTGAVIIPDLFHLHQSVLDLKAIQPGMPGSGTLGSATILLPAPYSEEGGLYADQYALLGKGQRAEAFRGDVITGTVAFSGVITGMDMPLSGPWTITVSDSLWILQQTQIYDDETIGSGTFLAHLLASSGPGSMFCAREVVFDDIGYTYTNTSGGGTIAQINSDPQFGLPGWEILTAGGWALTTESWNANQQFNWPNSPGFSTPAATAAVTATGTVFAGTDTNKAATAEILLGMDATFQNGLMVRLVSLQTGAGTGVYNINVEAWQISGGVFTGLGAVSNVFTNQLPMFPFQLMVETNTLDTHYWLNVHLNGKFTGLALSNTTRWTFQSPGHIGFRAEWNPGGSPTVYFNRLYFDSRAGINWGTPRFRQGSILTSGTGLMAPIHGQGQTHLDLLGEAATLDGCFLRKTPGFGYTSDSIDYHPSPGVDRSMQIVLREKENVVADGTTVGPVADLYATAPRLNSVPGSSDSGGSIIWPAPASANANSGDLVLIDTVSDMGPTQFSAMVNYARQVMLRKSAPLTALQVAFTRYADIADEFDLLDFISVEIPTLNVSHQKAQVIGTHITEGAGTQLVYLNQLPAQAMAQFAMDRLSRTIEYMSNSYARRA